VRVVFDVKKMPVFPNMVFPTAEQARQAPVGDMTLTVCDNCGFVFNQTFDESLLDFDQKYDNEQKHSTYYQNYLQGIITLLQKEVPEAQKIAEIGCGKGYFLELLLEKGFDAIGFDPTYEGENPKIVKDYFSEKYSTENADLLIMRHMLYTVMNPFELLHTIAKANHYKGKVYIEVLDFDWIVAHNSFCDICYEQVVYFTRDSLASFFHKSTVGNIFGGQYIYLIADLQDLRHDYTPSPKGGKHLQPTFEENVTHYKQLATQSAPLAIWGAGGKGVSFAHLIDAGKGIVPCLIDINPNKQNGFIAPHALPVLPPESALTEAGKTFKSIFIVNTNYLEEIKKTIENPSIEIMTFDSSPL
jgi:SAM-dependent methyltransferase